MRSLAGSRLLIMTKPSAIITGASGQDGLLASSVLVKRGFSVIGVTRDPDPGWRKRVLPEIGWFDWGNFLNAWPEIVKTLRPSVIIHLAGNSSVEESWKNPKRFVEEDFSLVSAVLNIASKTEVPVVMAGSSQIFASGLESVDESTRFSPSSPYGLAKLEAHCKLDLMRKKGDVCGSSLFMFNHESPIRRSSALSYRISSHLLNLKLGRPSSLVLANSNWAKDYSWAPDFAYAICNSELWKSNTDFIFASGQATTFGEMVVRACEKLELRLDEQTVCLRGTQPAGPLGNAEKARKILGLESRIPSEDIVYSMVRYHLDAENLGIYGPNRIRFLIDRTLEGDRPSLG